MYLAAAGIGKIGILDFDAWIFRTFSGRLFMELRTLAAKNRFGESNPQSINPNVEVIIHNTRITAKNALDLIRPYDIVVDGTDNFPTRYLTNDACVLLKKPNVYGFHFSL